MELTKLYKQIAKSDMYNISAKSLQGLNLPRAKQTKKRTESDSKIWGSG